jgi:hypothetical protein
MTNEMPNVPTASISDTVWSAAEKNSLLITTGK